MKSPILGLFVSVACGLVYLFFRPPLFNYDGYLYRLEALEPFSGSTLNPHHLLWYPLQLLLVKAAGVLGNWSTVPFQIVGILINCITLFFFYQLTNRAVGSETFAVGATVFVAFSPTFWFMGFQNQPYPLVYLFVVLYLRAWCMEQSGVLSTPQLVLAGASVAAAIFFQQAAAFLVPAGAVTLMVVGGELWRRRIVRGLIWGASTAVLVLAVYLGVARLVGVSLVQGFLSWTTRYIQIQHSLQITFPDSLAKSFMGIPRSVAQMYQAENFLSDHYSGATITGLYLGVGLVFCALVISSLGRAGFRMQVWELMRKNFLFTVSLFSIIAWTIFVVAWEPSGYYWSVNLFPVLLCVGLLVCPLARKGQWILAAALLLLSVWNVYANHAWDKAGSVNTPEPLLAHIQNRLEPRDIFIVLARDWFGDMDYGLVFECLDRYPNHRGRTILEQFVRKAQGSASWQQALEQEIESTLNQGGRAYVSDHVLTPDSYIDLAQAQDPFGEYVHQEYKDIDGFKLWGEIERFFQRYELIESDFRIGKDPFLEIRRP